MIQVSVKTNTTRKTVTAETTDTPAKIFADLGIDISSSKVNLNGVQLSVADMNAPFANLGVTDGASVSLNSIVKADGANR